MKSLNSFSEPFLQKYIKGLEESMEGREFVFASVNLLHFKFHRISLNCSASYIDSPKWLKEKKKSAINPKNNVKKVFSICYNNWVQP